MWYGVRSISLKKRRDLFQFRNNYSLLFKVIFPFKTQVRFLEHLGDIALGLHLEVKTCDRFLLKTIIRLSDCFFPTLVFPRGEAYIRKNELQKLWYLVAETKLSLAVVCPLVVCSPSPCPSSIQRFIVVFNLSIVSSFVRSRFSIVLKI